mmetsp:Transcript_25136/g.65562  ORF Transcript_25136/g.65562 Transcript_25136/m.65562 type:complete len:175 (-) Transcript_25136:209-733(-)
MRGHTDAPSGAGFGSRQSRFPALTSRLAVGMVMRPTDPKFVLADEAADGLRTRLMHSAVRASKPTSRVGTFPRATRTTVVIPKSVAADLEGYSYYTHADKESSMSWHGRAGRMRFNTVGRTQSAGVSKPFLPPVGTYDLGNASETRSNYRNDRGTKRAYKATRAPFNSTQSRNL